MDDKYSGNSFTLVQRDNTGHSTQIYILGEERFLNFQADDLRKKRFVVFSYRGVNQDAMLCIDDACRRANRGEEVDFTHLLD